MTDQQREFNYYCLDRVKPLTEELKISFEDDHTIFTTRYKVGLQAKIKHQDCFILYTESEKDLDEFIFIDADDFYNNQHRFFTEILSKTEVVELIKHIKTINIFEFVSLLDFTCIYQEFQDFIDKNWNILNMDNLIEL